MFVLERNEYYCYCTHKQWCLIENTPRALNKLPTDGKCTGLLREGRRGTERKRRGKGKRRGKKRIGEGKRRGKGGEEREEEKRRGKGGEEMEEEKRRGKGGEEIRGL